MKITVTQKHIKLGKSGSCYKCPIALAIFDVSTVDAKQIEVGESSICIGENEFSVPHVAAEFVNKFDNEESVEPLEFEIYPL